MSENQKRLDDLGLTAEFDSAVEHRDQAKVRDILKKAGISDNDTDAILWRGSVDEPEPAQETARERIIGIVGTILVLGLIGGVMTALLVSGVYGLFSSDSLQRNQAQEMVMHDHRSVAGAFGWPFAFGSVLGGIIGLLVSRKRRPV